MTTKENDPGTVGVGEPSRLVQKTVVIDRWLCRHTNHNHKTKDAAENCLASSQLTGKTRYDPAETWAFNRSIVIYVIEGLSYAAVARNVDRSTGRVGAIFNQTIRKICFNDECKKRAKASISEMRADKDFWLGVIKQIDDVIVDGNLWKARKLLHESNNE